jgi:2-oxoglutarate dehydrogenase E1 component
VNGEANREIDPNKVKRIVFCSGKVFYDLMVARRELGVNHVAISRITQLYPFPHTELKAQIDLYPNAKEVVWCQEEPGNQGAWHRIQHYLLRHMRPDQELGYALRPSSASPAVGYLKLHNDLPKALVAAAFREKLDVEYKRQRQG